MFVFQAVLQALLPSLSTAKGYKTTTHLQADHSAPHTPRAMITCGYMLEASSKHFQAPLLSLS